MNSSFFKKSAASSIKLYNLYINSHPDLRSPHVCTVSNVEREPNVSNLETGISSLQAIDQRDHTLLIEMFLNKLQYDGKKSKNYNTFVQVFNILQLYIQSNNQLHSLNPLLLFLNAIDNAKPYVEVKSIRIAGTTYRVPVELTKKRQYSLAIRWIIECSKNRNERTMPLKLAKEIYETASGLNTNTLKKREELHKMAESSRAFINYRW